MRLPWREVHQLCERDIRSSRRDNSADSDDSIACAVPQLALRAGARQSAVENRLQGHSNARERVEQHSEADEGDPSADKDESSVVKLEPRRRFSLLDDFHTHRIIQGTALRNKENQEEVGRHHERDENGAENRESARKSTGKFTSDPFHSPFNSSETSVTTT